MPRRHLDYFSPTADGPLRSKLDEHDDALDAAEAAIAGIEESLSETPEGPEPSDAAPQGIGTATAGVSANYSRADHVHALPADHVTDAMLRESAALSVIGRAANSIGNPADIAAAANLQYFGRRADALGFFSLTEDDLGTIADRQELAGAPTSITWTINGDADESYWIHGSGPVDDTSGDDLLIEINDVAMNSASHGTAGTGAGYLPLNVIGRTPADLGEFSFDLYLDVRRSSNSIAVAFLICRGWRIDTSVEHHITGGGACALASNAIKAELITTGRKFAPGFKTIVRRRKLSA
jgi:hypothetical protein